jgi:cytochrome b subunit of formate dehydrogenase
MDEMKKKPLPPEMSSADQAITKPSVEVSVEPKKQTFIRFDISQRLEHLIFIISFSILGATGLAQKFADSPLGFAFLRFLGGIEVARAIHHVSAITMGVVSVYHLIGVLYRVIVLRTPLTMLPVFEDFKHLFQDILYFIGIRKHRAYYGRYNYAEKVEYLAVVWGTLIMGITGFMMWNPISTTRFLPGQAIPAAKAAHGGEAILAVLAIIIWHFYHVHLRQFNKSMFTGKLSREEMLHEHPAELAQVESSKGYTRPPDSLIRKRQMIFTPIALSLTLVFGLGLYKFTTIETTAISAIPQEETAAIFVPLTPTPRPTLAPTVTSAPIEGAAILSWKGTFGALFRNRCSNCHGVTAVSGLSLATYMDALKGGSRGPSIVPGNPDASILVNIQSLGNHPGQLTIDELNSVIQWIVAGAPEQ